MSSTWIMPDYGAFAPGHFYSPIPDLAQVQARAAQIYPSKVARTVPGVNLHGVEQLSLLRQFAQYHDTQPFFDDPTPGLRYNFINPAYGYGDAVILHSMIRHLKPKKLIEIGSGYSSAVTLDTNELFFGDKIYCTFIEPYPKLLLSLMKEGDNTRHNIIPKPVQSVGTELFSQLSAGDILFVDSTHVSKVGSDVNTIFFEILPSLKKGVYIHFHDVFYPFEYPKDWTSQGLFWNEDYLLRAFLSFNDSFEIVFFNHFLTIFHSKEIRRYLPLMLKNPGGSIWLRKIK